MLINSCLRSREMLGNILHKNGNENILAELLPCFQEKYDPDITYSVLAKGANETRDELKHGHHNPDSNYEGEISEPLAAQMLMRAMVNYKNMEVQPSQKMYSFYNWVKEREDEICSEW